MTCACRAYFGRSVSSKRSAQNIILVCVHSCLKFYCMLIVLSFVFPIIITIMSRLTRFWIIFIFWFLWPAFLKNEIVYSHIENIGGEDLSDQATIIKTIEPNNIENDIDDHVINNINLDHTNHITITKKRFDYFLSDWNIFFQWNLDSSLVLMLGILSTVLVGVCKLLSFLQDMTIN